MLIGTLFVLCVAIVLAVSLPVSTAFAAEGEPEATIHDHNDRTWTELTADGGTLESGNYYLAGDVTLTTDITIADNATVTLCLNGYTLTGTVTNAVITFNEGVDFTLEDCSADASAPAGRGVITGGIGFLDEYTIRRGGGVYMSGNSTFTMNGGTISGNTATTGGGVGVDNDGTFIMTGGTISGNSAYDSGGGVYVVNGDTFTMTGGTISDNTAKTFGGGVDVESGTFTMTVYGVSVNYINNAQVNAGEHTVTAKFTGDYTNYNTIDDMTAMLTIDKAMPVYTTPENLTACIEHTLADVTLPAGWTWEDSTLSVGETGEKQFKAIFTPEDTNNYERALVNVTLTVAEHIDENDDGICDSCGVKFRNIVTVAGGTIEGVTGSTCTVDENDSVTVVVGEAPEGKEFKVWSVDGGETIISEEAAYAFTASEDTVLTAVFADKQSDVKPGGEITPENPEGLSGGAIAGIVIGSVLGALIIAYGVCALLYKKKILKGAFFEKIYPFIKD